MTESAARPLPNTDFKSPGCAVVLSSLAANSFLLLLSGYLVFNRTFANLGFPPVYIGEIALAFAIFAASFQFKNAFIEPLKRSFAMKLVAAFLFYGMVRIGVDYPERGLNAARDGTMCLYAISAFLVPWLMECINQQRLPARQKFNEFIARDESRLSRTVFNVLRFASVPAVIWGWAIYKGWIHAPASVKVDFLTLSAAVAAVAFTFQTLHLGAIFSIALEMCRCGEPAYKKGFREICFAFPFSFAVSIASVALVFCLPTRAVQVGLIGVALIMLGVGFVRFRPRGFLRLSGCIVVVIAIAGCAGWMAMRSTAFREKVEAMADFNERHFRTHEGQLAAHSEQWRLAFWRRCITETWLHAPVFGVGFGTNLTEMMRGTPDWPLFEDSQNVAKYGSPNRHPHSAHVSVFARLGIVGEMMWLGILAFVLVQAISNCRRTRLRIEKALPPNALGKIFATFNTDMAILCVWLIYVIAMSLGVVLENPFGGIWFWTLTGVIANRPPPPTFLFLKSDEPQTSFAAA